MGDRTEWERARSSFRIISCRWVFRGERLELAPPLEKPAYVMSVCEPNAGRIPVLLESTDVLNAG